jgi:lipoyl(octanoyl) transferase
VTGDWKNQDHPDGKIAASGNVFTGHRRPTAQQDPAFPSRLTPCFVVDLGLVPYAEAYELQRHLVAARKADAIEDVLLLCEHPHVITIGRNGRGENLLASDRVLQQKNVELHSTDRGGDITYHGPGQIVAYPILNLAAIRRDVGWYVRMLEETMIRATAGYGITAEREPGKTGIWVSDPSQRNPAEKLGAIGVHLSRWVTSHGFAYNVSTDLRYFDLIVPCGIADRKATSLEKLTNRTIDKREAATSLAKHLAEIFGFRATSMTSAELLDRLPHIESSAHDHQPAAVSA